MKIFKYEIPISDYFSLEVSAGAQVLSAQAQQEVPCLWVLEDDTAASIEVRWFRLTGTGLSLKESKEKLRFIDSFQTKGGRLVYHLFEII
jgi:hypothetical protein